MKLYIRAMSEYSKDLRRKIVYVGEQVAIHLTKIIQYPTSQYLHHWEREVYSYLHKVSKTKNGKKFPSASFIYEALTVWTDAPDVLKLEVQERMSECDIEPVEISDNELEAKLNSYMKWISKKLSATGFVSSNEIYQFIEENLI